MHPSWQCLVYGWRASRSILLNVVGDSVGVVLGEWRECRLVSEVCAIPHVLIKGNSAKTKSVIHVRELEMLMLSHVQDQHLWWEEVWVYLEETE